MAHQLQLLPIAIRSVAQEEVIRPACPQNLNALSVECEGTVAVVGNEAGGLADAKTDSGLVGHLLAAACVQTECIQLRLAKRVAPPEAWMPDVEGWRIVSSDAQGFLLVWFQGVGNGEGAALYLAPQTAGAGLAAEVTHVGLHGEPRLVERAEVQACLDKRMTDSDGT